MRFLHAVVTVCAAAACTSAPSLDEREEDWIVLVKSCRIPEEFDWYARFAHHQWIDARDKDTGRWRRIEVRAPGMPGNAREIDAVAARSELRWNRTVATQAELRGEEARRVLRELEAAVDRRGPRYADEYRAWPGPNSNTFIRELCDDIDGLGAVLDHNAVGKDHDGFASAGLATSETGVRGDLGPLGLTLAAQEGVKLRLLGLELGVQTWPPALHLPALPPLPWPARPDHPARPDAQSMLTVGDAGIEWIEYDKIREESWSSTWVRNDASSWAHATCTLSSDGGEWRVEACSWNGDRRATQAASFANSDGAGHEVMLEGAGLEVRLKLVVEAPGRVRESVSCRSGYFVQAAPPEKATQPSTAP
jgi:hypothetical protein